MAVRRSRMQCGICRTTVTSSTVLASHQCREGVERLPSSSEGETSQILERLPSYREREASQILERVPSSESLCLRLSSSQQSQARVATLRRESATPTRRLLSSGPPAGRLPSSSSSNCVSICVPPALRPA